MESFQISIGDLKESAVPTEGIERPFREDGKIKSAVFWAEPAIY